MCCSRLQILVLGAALRTGTAELRSGTAVLHDELWPDVLSARPLQVAPHEQGKIVLSTKGKKGLPLFPSLYFYVMGIVHGLCW